MRDLVRYGSVKKALQLRHLVDSNWFTIIGHRYSPNSSPNGVLYEARKVWVAKLPR
jgi:hypothetical protein